jgi:putative redox protein
MEQSSGGSHGGGEERRRELSASDPRVVTVSERARGFAQTIHAGRHLLSADEPVGAGGGDTGPDPYALLLAALGACTSMTIRLYADRKKWPLEHVSVRLRHERTYAEDCARCEEEERRLDRMTREIALSGPLSAEQKRRLVEIAERCPVHRTLVGRKEIVTRLAES